LEKRESEILDVPYFHVVFTLPERVAVIAYQNKVHVYDILFRTASETLQTIAADPKHLGTEIGFFSVLHTWGSALTHHPHLHIVVAGGGLSPDGTRWISCRSNYFFLPVKVLSRLFRRLFLQALQQAFDAGNLQFFSALEPLRTPQAFRRYLAPLWSAEWVVYTKAPFDGPQQVLRYVARYTHRVAISNDRLLDIEDGRVSFSWKDYRDNNQRKTMTLAAQEFIRRFLMHVLPKGFQRIRHYGFLANCCRGRKLALCRQLLRMPPHEPGCYLKKDYRQRYEELTGRSLTQCPVCQQGEMLVIEVLPDTRLRRHKRPAPPPQFAHSPPFMDTSYRCRDLTRMVHDAAAVQRRESYASTPAHASINSRQRPCRQLGAASIPSKRRYNDDAIVPRGAFEHHAAVLACIKRP
jgi:hypothetical protein